MSSTLPIALVAGLVAGGVGAFAVTAMQSPATTKQTTALGSDSGLDALVASIDGLRRDNEEIKLRLDRIEVESMLASPESSRAPAAAGLSAVDLTEQVKAALSDLEASGEPLVTPDFRRQVENVLAVREEEERLEREQRRIDEAAKRIEDRLASLQTSLGLDQSQVNGMREILQSNETKRDEMRTAAREARESGVDTGVNPREMWTTMRDEMNTQIQGILTPAQYEQYQETNNDRGFGGRRGGGGGDAGGGGRGGRGGF